MIIFPFYATSFSFPRFSVLFHAFFFGFQKDFLPLRKLIFKSVQAVRSILIILLLVLLGVTDRVAADQREKPRPHLLKNSADLPEVGEAALPMQLIGRSELFSSYTGPRLLRSQHPLQKQFQRLCEPFSLIASVRHGGGWHARLKSSYLISRYAESTPAGYLVWLDRLII